MAWPSYPRLVQSFRSHQSRRKRSQFYQLPERGKLVGEELWQVHHGCNRYLYVCVRLAAPLQRQESTLDKHSNPGIQFGCQVEKNMRQIAAAGRHWVRCVAVLSIALCHFLLAADSGGSREIPVTGIYLNSEYGYSVRIPENLHASRLAAPAPNHGFGITLRKEPESYIWTNGEYDALMIEDLDVLAHEEASALGDQGMKIVKITKSTLGGAEARDVTLAAGGDE